MKMKMKIKIKIEVIINKEIHKKIKVVKIM